MWQGIYSTLRKQNGQGLIELALIISVVALMVVASLQKLEGGVSGVMEKIGISMASKGDKDGDKAAPKNQVAKNSPSGGGNRGGGGESENHLISPDSVLVNGVGSSVGSLSVSGSQSNASDNSQQTKQGSGSISRKSLVRGVERPKEDFKNLKVLSAKKEEHKETPKKPEWAKVKSGRNT
jgi:Flp pilus assembly pilin Flp